MDYKCNASTMQRKIKWKKKSPAADNKKTIHFVPRCEIWRDAVFKLTDCPRNVGDSATLSDKEDLISMFFQEKKNPKQNNATSILLFIQCKKTDKENKNRKKNIICLLGFPLQLTSPFLLTECSRTYSRRRRGEEHCRLDPTWKGRGFRGFGDK